MKTIQEKLASLKSRYKAKFKELNKAIKLAAKSLKEKLLTMNEFRGQITDQTQTFIPRLEHSSDMKKVNMDTERNRDDIKVLREAKAAIEGEISKITTDIGRLVESNKKTSDNIQDLRESRAELQGKASKFSVNTALAIALIGIILTIISFFLN